MNVKAVHRNPCARNIGAARQHGRRNGSVGGVDDLIYIARAGLNDEAGRRRRWNGGRRRIGTNRDRAAALIVPRYAGGKGRRGGDLCPIRSEEHTSELQSLMRISYAVFCLKKKTKYN